jgi:hypothetical protein
MTTNNKKILIISFLLLIIGIATWFVLFPYGTKWLESRITLTTEDLRQKGYVVSYSALKISGNPFYVQAIIQNPHLKDPRGVVEWQGQEIRITMKPWEPYILSVSLPGDQKVSVPQNPALPLGILHLEGAKSTVHLTSKGHLENVTLTVDHLVSFLETQPQSISLRDLSLHVGNIVDPLNLKLSLSTQLMNIDKLLSKESRDHSLMVNLVADLSGFKSEFPFPKSFAEWRDGGGVVEVRLLKIDWPPILAEIEGTLTLDEALYPLGSFSSRISGYREAIEDMIELGWLKKKKGVVALFMLDLLSSSGEKGEKQLKAPITLQNKRLSVGPVPLLKLKPIGQTITP